MSNKNEQPRVGIIVIPGLGTPASGDCHTLRILSQKLADLVNGIVWAIEYDKVTAQAVVEWVEKNNISVLVIMGHSFGGAALKWLLDQFAAMDDCFVHLSLFFDPAPNGPLFHQFFSWQKARNHNMLRWEIQYEVTDAVVCFYQTGQVYLELPILGKIGICGVPFRVPGEDDEDREKLMNIDCTPWNLDHNGIPESPVVHKLVEHAFRTLMTKHEIVCKELN